MIIERSETFSYNSAALCCSLLALPKQPTFIVYTFFYYYSVDVSMSNEHKVMQILCLIRNGFVASGNDNDVDA